MADEFKTIIGQLATFMICAQAIAHFRPRDSYAKYLRMLLSVMILVQIFQPFCRLLWGISGEELYAGVEAFQEELDKSMAAVAEQSARAGVQLENMSLLEVQERLAEQEKKSAQGEAGMPQEVMTGQSGTEVMEQLQGEEKIREDSTQIDKVESVKIRIGEK